MKKHFLRSLLFSFFSMTVLATPFKLPTQQSYLNGRQMCDTLPTLAEIEKGFYTSVPVDYQNAQKGLFEVYSWFQEGYRPELPTLVYLTGGPGQTSHWGQAAFRRLQFNVLLVDQRGIACSKPLTVTEALTPHFYSSENIARDLEMIRQSLKITKWSVFGVSYGTIPATIYASLFPQATTAVILEGTVFAGPEINTSERRKKMILETLQAMPRVVRKNIFEIEKKTGIQSAWFFRWTRDILLQNNGQQILKESLEKLSDPIEFAEYTKMLKENYGPQPDFPKNELFIPNDLPYFMLYCQEFGLDTVENKLDLRWNGEKIEAVANPDLAGTCQTIQAPLKNAYQAVKYPIQAPVTYFQGEDDAATEISGAMKHYTQVPKAFKQMLKMKKGGHNPNLQVLQTDEPMQQEIIEAVVRGQKIELKQVQNVNKTLEYISWELINL